MFCSECGYECQANAKFCKSCGLSLVESVKTTKDVPFQPTESRKTNSVDFGGALPTSTPILTSSKSHSTTNPALWNPNAAASWSLPLSAAFGAYLQMLNWRALGEHENARKSQIWFYIILFLPIPLILFAADAGNLAFALDVIPRGLPLPIVIAWYFLSGKAQSKYVKEKLGDNYPRQPWGKTLLIGFGLIIAYWALIVTLFGIWGASGALGIQKTVAQTATTFDSASARPADNATNLEKEEITPPAYRPDEINKFLADAPQQDQETTVNNFLKKSWLERVSVLQEKVRSGTIAHVDAQIIPSPKENEGYLPAADVTLLENSQTWWREPHNDNLIFVHIINSSQYNISTIGFGYSPLPCENHAGSSSFTLQLNSVIPPNHEAVATFKSEEIGTARSNTECLTITNAWG